MADNHAPQPTSAAATISAASVPTSGISHPPAYVAVAGGYASVGGPGFPPPAAIPLPSQSVPAALPPSPVSGAPVHAYATAGVGTAAQQQQHTDYTSPQQQVTTVVPTGSYQGGGVVGSDGVNGAATGGSGGPAAAPETTPAAVTAAGTGTEATAGGGSTSSARDNGAPASGGSSKSSLKRVRVRVIRRCNSFSVEASIQSIFALNRFRADGVSCLKCNRLLEVVCLLQSRRGSNLYAVRRFRNNHFLDKRGVLVICDSLLVYVHIQTIKRILSMT